MADRPNFIFVIPDQLRADALGCFGNERARTPQYGLTEPVTRPGFRKDYPSDEWARVFYRGKLDDGLVNHDEAAIRTVERWLADPPEQPWVLFVPLFAPHCPFQAEEPWFSLHDRDGQPDPVPAADREPRFKAGIRAKYGLDRITPAMWREVAAVYHGMVSRLDDQVGRVQAALAASAAAENTVTAFFADHGEYLGDYGLIEKWPSAVDPCITRDPLILSGGPVPAGVRSGAMVELIDVLPTVLELAGITPAHRHFGRSLVPLFTDPGGEHRAYAFTEGGFTVAEEPQLERPAFP